MFLIILIKFQKKMVKAEYLVVDSGGFIVGNSLWEIGTHVITLNEVINEIRDNATRRRILVVITL